MAGQVGIAPADLDRSDLFGVLAMLGNHRHPDYWLSDHDLTPELDERRDDPDDGERRPRARGRRRGPIASGRGSSPGLQAREESRAMFAARRAAARGEAPPPEAAPLSADALNVADVFARGGVTRAH